jgi:hypothetical protein
MHLMISLLILSLILQLLFFRGVGAGWPSSSRFCNKVHRKEYEVETSPSKLIHLNT